MASDDIAIPVRTSELANVAAVNLTALELSVSKVATLTENLRGALVETEYIRVVSRGDMNRIQL
ncbi:MAG: hypothetical protein ISS35_00330 [Kiritimatiellae bacterium]|nr:hypothetical protein [Kiritimatiellia bacterium]